MEQKQLMKQLADFMSGCPFSWAVCGGFALDLFREHTLRLHGDIDICVFEKDRQAVLDFIIDKGWQVYEFRGQGKVRPLSRGEESDAGRNLMAVKEGCEIVKFYSCDEEGWLYHQFFHTGIREINYLEFLFNGIEEGCLVQNPQKTWRRELPKAILHNGWIPYLAPEIVLVYKAAQWDKPDYQFDYEQSYPYLQEDQKEWFLQTMKRMYPEGHRWIP